MGAQIEAVLRLKDHASEQLKKLSGNAKVAGKEVDNLSDDMKGAAKSTGIWYDKQGKLRNEMGKFVKITKEARSETKKTGDSFRAMGMSLGSIAKWGAAAAAVGGVIGAKFAASAIEASASMETFEAQLTTLLKSSTAAKTRLDELFKIGSTTPFELADLVKADVLIQSFGQDAGELRGGIMDLAGAMSKDLPEAAMAVAKSMAVGKAGSDGLKESFSLLYTDVLNRANEMGDTKDIKIWQAAMTAALNDVNGVVAGGTKALAGTFKGQMSNMADQWFKFKKMIGDAGLFQYAKVGLDEFLGSLSGAEDDLESIATAISTTVIDSFDGLIRVAALLSQAILGAVGGVKFLAQGLADVELILLKTSSAMMELEKAGDVFGSLDKGTLLGDEKAKKFDDLQRKIQENEIATRRWDKEMMNLSDSFFALGNVGDNLDSIRDKINGIATAADGVNAITYIRAGVEYTIDPKGVETASRSVSRNDTNRNLGFGYGVWSDASPTGSTIGPGDTGFGVLAAPDTKTKTSSSNGQQSPKGKNAATKLFDDLAKSVEKLIPKETLTDVEKLNALLVMMKEAMSTTRKSSSRDWGSLIKQAETAKTALIAAAEVEAAEERAKDIEKFAVALDKAGRSATKSARELSGTWLESDKLTASIAVASASLAAFRGEAVALGLSSTDTSTGLAALESNLQSMKTARSKAYAEENAIAAAAARESMSIHERMWFDVVAFADTQSSAFSDSLGSGMKSLGGSIMSGIGSAIQGVTSLGTGGLSSIVGAAGPYGAAAAGISQLGQMGYTKTEEFVDPVTGETKTREVEVSAAEAIGEQMEGFLDGLIVGLVEVLPELIGTVIPAFIADGVPALLEGVFKAIPELAKAIFLGLPVAFAKGLFSWWGQVWDAIKSFFDAIGETGGGAAIGAGIGAGVGFLVGGPAGAAIGAGVGGAAGGLIGSMHSGGVVDRTGPMLLQQGERVVPNSGAGTQSSSGLAAFGLGGGGANVTINTNVVDNDSIDRLGALLDEHYGSYGRNTVGIFGG